METKDILKSINSNKEIVETQTANIKKDKFKNKEKREEMY